MTCNPKIRATNRRCVDDIPLGKGLMDLLLPCIALFSDGMAARKKDT
jgi:hypothetical protein